MAPGGVLVYIFVYIFVYICTLATLHNIQCYIIAIAIIMMPIPDEDLQKSNAKADRAKKLEME